MSAQRILIFGGTFDPIHHGHLIAAQAAAEALAADRVLLVVARQSPLKTAPALAPDADRRAMLESAVAGVAAFGVCDLELRRPAPSYTIDTLAALRAQMPEDHLILLLGADQLPALHTWRRAPELVAQNEIAVMARPDAAPQAGLQVVREQLGAAAAARLRMLATPLIAISATAIRKRVADGLPIHFLVPPAVESYIAEHDLYRKQGAS